VIVRRSPWARVASVLCVASVLGAAACSDDADQGALGADTCEQLVDEAATVAAQVVEELRDKTSAELDPGTEEDPFPELTRPFAAFEARAEQLGCDRGELRRLACSAYTGIEATGPATEEFLASVDAVCP
jgi:hypothetical protein